MTTWSIPCLLAVLGAADPAPAADRVTLRDGSVVLGQVIEPSPRGTVWLVVRRKWAASHLPEWAKRWEAAEGAVADRAIRVRRDRLADWRRERAATTGAADRVLSWIDREVKALADPAAEREASTLMVVKLGRAEVRGIERRTRAEARRLRQGWLAGFPNPEEMSTVELGDALEGRGFAPGGDEPVSVDALLPIPVETDSQWLLRRAATEVTYDAGLRFLQQQNLVFPEPEPGRPPNLTGVATLVNEFKRLLDDDHSDPVPVRLRDVAARGRAGAIVTKFDLAPDLAGVTVETALWVRQGPDRWVKAGWRSATVRTADLGGEAGADLADDPQVRGAFELVEALGFGRIADDVKRQSLSIGAATRKALGLARSAMSDELGRLTLPVRSEAEEPKPAAGR